MDSKKERSGVSYDDVVAAYRQLTDEGRSNSYREIRKALGDTGSLGTIKKHIDKMKAAKAEVAAVQITMPVEAQQLFIRLVQDGIDQQEKKHSVEMQELRSGIDELANESEENAAVIEAHLESIAVLDEMLKELGGKHELLEKLHEKTLVSEAAERAEAERVRIALAEANLQLKGLPELKAQLKELQEKLEAVRQDKENVAREAAVLASRLESEQMALSEAKAREHAAIKSVAVVQGEKQEMASGLDNALLRAIKAESELASWAKYEAKAEKEIERLRAQIDVLNGEAKALREEAKADAKAKSTANKEGK